MTEFTASLNVLVPNYSIKPKFKTNHPKKLKQLFAHDKNGSMEVIADSVNECLYLNDNVSPFTWRVRLKGGRALEGIPE